MVQYILNATAIWFISLMIFDLFLKKETHHSYNRAYLLSTLILGVVLPLFKWHASMAAIYYTVYSKPVQGIITARQNMVVAATTTIPHAADKISVIYGVYFTGVAIAILFLLNDVLKLINYSRRGLHKKENGIVIIETGKDHAPFSIFNIIYINNRHSFTEAEWQAVYSHELRHKELLHFIDVLIVQLACVVFWFHPLVYIYRRRLLMVHEYQADALYAPAPSEYGRFLIRQSLLAKAPVITHSFNRSPIKSRIAMLTSKSSRRSIMKFLVVVPLVAGCMLCFTQPGYSFKKGAKNTIVFKGNEFEFGYEGSPAAAPSAPSAPAVINGKPGSKTIMIRKTNPDNAGAKLQTDTEVGDSSMSVAFFSAPLKMNGKKIYSEGDVKPEPVFQGKDKSLADYLFNGASDYLNLLGDGTYEMRISYPIIDEKGKLVYYGLDGMIAYNRNMKIDKDLQKKINDRLEELLDGAPSFKPATLNGSPVIFYWSWGVPLGTHVVVKDHKAKLVVSAPSNY